MAVATSAASSASTSVSTPGWVSMSTASSVAWTSATEWAPPGRRVLSAEVVGAQVATFEPSRELGDRGDDGRGRLAVPRRQARALVRLGPATRDAHEHAAEIEDDEFNRRRRVSTGHRGSLRRAF
jgi:hypothetical protein